MAKKKRSENEKKRAHEYGKEYYADNAERIQEERAKRYAEDPEYRARMQKSAKRRYWLGTRPATTGALAATIPDVELATIEPKGTIQVPIDNEHDVRFGTTVEVPVYTTAALEILIGRNSQTIRVWLKEGILPEPHFRGRMLPGVRIAKGRNPRLFTLDEMQVIEACRPHLKLPSHGKKHDIFTRCVVEGFSGLRQGLVPQAV